MHSTQTTNQPNKAKVETELDHETLGSLVKRVQQGDREAFDTLFRATVDRTKSLIRSLTRQHHLVDDLVQEIYVLVWQKIHWLREPKTFRAWLNRIAVHRTYRLMDTDRKTGWAGSLEASNKDPKSSADCDPGQSLPLLLDLQSAFKKISKEDQALIVLREVHAFSYEELADTLAVPIGTIRSRLHFTRKKLLRHFDAPSA